MTNNNMRALFIGILLVLACIGIYVASRDSKVADSDKALRETSDTVSVFTEDLDDTVTTPAVTTDNQVTATTEKEQFLDETNDEITVLREQVVIIRNNPNDRTSKLSAEVERKLTELKKMVSDAKKSTQENWEDLKVKISNKYESIKHKLSEAM